MSFDKEYPNRKDRRKPYRGSREFDTGCRNHGSCKVCLRNRLFQITKERRRTEEDLNAYENGELQ